MYADPMSKRKADGRWDWHPKCKKPQWPQDGEAWTEEDWLSAATINGLALEPGTACDGLAKPPIVYPKCSRLVQALDLASDFNDMAIWNVDAWTPLPALPSTVVRIRNLPPVPRFTS